MSLPDPVSSRHRRVSPVSSSLSKNSTHRLRFDDRKPRPPRDAHQKANGPLGAILTTAIAAGFLAYIFNWRGFATWADAFFNGLNASAQSQNNAVVTSVFTALPFAGLLIGALILYSLVRWLLRVSRRS